MSTVLDPTLPSRAAEQSEVLVTLDLPEYGKLIVREEFDLHCGETYFTVVKGARASGTFTVSAFRWGPVAIPTAVGIWYGRGDAAANQLDRTDRPLVNGIELAGGSHWPDPENWHSFHPVDNVNAHTATSRISSVRAPERTQHRAGVIVIALLGHYMQHPLRPSLQRAAGEFAAARRLRDLDPAVARLRSEIAEKHEAIARLEAQIAVYAQLEAQLRELADSHTQRTTADRAGEKA